MKTSFKFFAVLVVSALVSTASFAKTIDGTNDEAASKNAVAINALSNDRGVRVSVLREENAGKAYVVIYDNDKNVLRKDALPKNVNAMEKGYLIKDLEAGDYTIEVVSNNQSETKKFHVYEDEGKKSFFFYQDQK